MKRFLPSRKTFFIATAATVIVLLVVLYKFVRPSFAIALLAVVALTAVLSLLYRYISPQNPTDKKDFIQLVLVAIGGIVAIASLWVAWATLRQGQENVQETLANTRGLEEERAEEAALQSYLQEMARLISDHGLPESERGDSLRTISAVQTTTVLDGLKDPTRKRILLKFLHDADLIKTDNVVVNLEGANLEEADLSEMLLTKLDKDPETGEFRASTSVGDYLPSVNLRKANLNNAYLWRANLFGAQLNEANLNDAGLIGVDLTRATLSGATLRNALLDDAKLEDAKLDGADLTNARLNGVTLSENTDFKDAYLTCAKLRNVSSNNANFNGVDLEHADLRGADFQEAINLTQEQVDKASGDQTTQLPDTLTPPDSWSESVEEWQRNIQCYEFH